MAEVSLELFKKMVRADDFSDDDEVLQRLLDTAEVTVLNSVNRTLDECKAMDDKGAMPLPLQQATIQIAAHWYNQRENVSVAQMHEVPYTTSALMKPYRKLVEDTEV